jgi:hypothetical protein
MLAISFIGLSLPAAILPASARCFARSLSRARLLGFRNMGIEQRQSARQIVNRPAWVDAGAQGAKRDCVLVDISDTGARLELDPAAIPETFSLLLSPGGEERRACRIVWRSTNQIGVQFQSA